jgi:23S rRNA (guanosine2251-2'-O)-methyltransferase
MSERIICGINTVNQALARRPAQLRRIYLQDSLGAERLGRLADDLGKHAIPTERVTAAVLDKLTGGSLHQGVAAAIAGLTVMDDYAALDYLGNLKDPLILVLDGIEDPRNYGACLRTAEGAGVDLVVSGRNRGVDITPAVSKVASGAAETQPIARVANLARFLRSLQALNIWIVGTDERAPITLYEANLSGALAVVMGAEGKGMRHLTREHCDVLVRLPMRGMVESLNIAVAAGICLYECVRQRG